MAKGQMRSNKEKKKPKAEWNKSKKSGPALYRRSLWHGSKSSPDRTHSARRTNRATSANPPRPAQRVGLATLAQAASFDTTANVWNFYAEGSG